MNIKMQSTSKIYSFKKLLSACLCLMFNASSKIKSDLKHLLVRIMRHLQHVQWNNAQSTAKLHKVIYNREQW